MYVIQKHEEIYECIEGLDAIIFDMDDTLYGEKEYVRSGYRIVAKQLPMIPDAYDKLWTAFQKKQSAFDVVLEEAGCYSEELKQKCLQAYRYQEPDIHLYAGVREVLTELRRRGYKLGIITDGRVEGQRAKIQALGLEELVDEIIITDELGGVSYRKPCDVAFKKMAQLLQVSYDKMCYIGDNLGKDFLAPETLGMRTIWFENQDGIYHNIG